MQAWGGSFYDDCTSNQDPAFADVFYKNNIAQVGKRHRHQGTKLMKCSVPL